MKEEWREVEGYPNYLVSNLGTIKSIARDEYMDWKGASRHHKEKHLKPIQKDGKYMVIALHRGDKKQRSFYIHRVVAKAFYKPNGKFLVNHKDGDKTNNALSNLEIISQRDNCLHRLRKANKSSKYPGVHLEARTQRYKAFIRIHGRKKFLGYFDDEELAYETYKEAVLDIEKSVPKYL